MSLTGLIDPGPLIIISALHTNLQARVPVHAVCEFDLTWRKSLENSKHSQY